MTKDDELFKRLFSFVARIHSVAQQHSPQRQGSFRGQGRIIFLLAKNEGISQRQLADLAQIKPSSLTQLLERLEKDQLIDRRRDKDDRRIIRVWLTAKGKEKYANNLLHRRKYEQLLLDEVSDAEKAVFIQVLDKMLFQINSLECQKQKEGKN